MSSVCATAFGRSAGSDRPASSTIHAPSGQRPAIECAAACARRLLPMPPAPTTVTSLCASISERRASGPRRGRTAAADPSGRLVRRATAAHWIGSPPVSRLALRRCVAVRCAVERGGEPVTASRDRRNGLRAQQLAQRADLHLKVVLLDHQPRPDQGQKIVLRHELARSGNQRHQQVECARAQGDRCIVRGQTALRRLQFESTEPVRWRVSSGLHGRSLGPLAARGGAFLHASATFNSRLSGPKERARPLTHAYRILDVNSAHSRLPRKASTSPPYRACPFPAHAPLR